MKWHVLALIAVMLSGCSASPPSASMEKSPQGHEFAFLHLPEVKEVAIRIAWPTDWSRREDANQAVPYIAADLILAGGADGYPAGKVGEKFADLKAEGHLSPTVDALLGELTVPKENLREAVEIANAHLRAPTFDEKWLERIRDGLARNVAEMNAQPVIKGNNALRFAIIGDGPLRRARSIDPPEMIAKVNRDDVSGWLKAVVTGNNAKIAISGNITAQEAAETIDALLRDLPDHGTDAALPEPKAQYGSKRILLHVADAKTSTLTLVGPMPPTRTGGELEDLVLVKALGNGDQSILFDAIRTKLRAAYDFAAVLDGYTRENRVLFLTGEVETGKLAETEAAVRDAYQHFLTEGYHGDLAAAKASFAGYVKDLPKRAGDAAQSTLMGLLDGESADTILKLPAKVDALTEGSINARLKSAFPRPDAFVILAVSPDALALPGACVIENARDAANCPPGP